MDTSKTGTRLRSAVAAIVVLLGVGACFRSETDQKQADLILHNGVVFSADAAGSTYSAIVIAGSKVVAVGGPALTEQFHAANVVDLDGRLAMPGFNDAHTHMRGRPMRWIGLSEVTSIKEIQELVAAKAAELPPNSWITGYGWSEDRLGERRKLTRHDLDAVVPNNPTLLTREGGHSAVANARALAIAEITETSPQPEGGEFEKDADGALTGIIRERHALVMAHIPAPDPAEVMADLERRLRGQLAYGITSLTDASTSADAYRAIWQPLYASASGPLPRATIQIRPNLHEHSAEEAIAILREFGLKTGDGDAWLKVGALKAFVDGGFTGPAAWTRQPYKNDPTYFGKLSLDLQELETLSRDAHGTGWQLGFHAIGDAAIEETVAVISRVLADRPRADHRHYLNHFTVLPSDETLQQMAANGIGIVQQPNFTASLEGRYTAYLDGERLARNNAVKTPMAAGIAMAFSSDIIPIGPLYGIHAAVTRRGESGRVFGADERIGVAEAIRAYTAAGAQITFDEDVKGTLAPGRLADIVVLSRNILDAPPEAIRETDVDLTILGGKIVYSRAP